LHVRAETGVMVAEFTGIDDDPDNPTRAAVPGSMRPQVTGIFTDLTPATAPDGLESSSVHVTVDSRYSSSPTAIKLVLMVVGVLLLHPLCLSTPSSVMRVLRVVHGLAALASLLSLRGLDAVDRLSDRRCVPRSCTRSCGPGGIVVPVPAFGQFVGANTSDNGY